MKTKTLVLTVILAGLAMAPLALAAPEDGPRGRGPREGMGGGFGGLRGDGNVAQMLLGRLGEELNLTDDQKAGIRKIAEESRDAVQANRDAVQEAMQALNEAAEDGNEAKIKAAGTAAGEALTKQALQRAEIQKKVKEILTDEQEKKWDELRSEMRQRMQSTRQERREGQGPGRRGRGGNNAGD